MADLRDAFEAKGFRSSQPATSQPRQGDGGGRGGRQDSGQQTLQVPDGYPKYFKGTDSKGQPCLDPAYVSDLAEKIANQLKNASPKLTRHQLRAFFDHAKRQVARVQDGCDFCHVNSEVQKMQAIAASRATKTSASISTQFLGFITRNVRAVRTKEDLEKGFVKHFEAVVAFCADAKD